MSTVTSAPPAPATQRTTSTRPQTSEPRAWNVVLLDDDDHTYEYVIEMMQTLFAHSKERAFLIARTVDTRGRAVCLTTHKEHAELKRDQILAFGKDPRLARCAGSMSAILEPATGDDDDAGGQSGSGGGNPDGAGSGGAGSGGAGSGGGAKG